MADNGNGGTKDDESGGGEDDSGGDEVRPAPWRDMDRLTEAVRPDGDDDAESGDE